MSRIIRALAATAALLAVVVGVPLLLVTLAGWPLPTEPPDWSNVARMLEQGDVAGSSIVKGLACVVWAAWAVVAWAVVWEAVVNVPRMLDGRRHRPNPLAPATLSKGVGWLFAFLIATASTPQTAHATAPLESLHHLYPTDSADVSLLVDADIATTAPPEASAFDRDEEVAHTEVWIVDDTDSLWSISQRTGVSIDDVLAINGELTATTMLAVGTHVVLPAGADVPDERRERRQAGVAGDFTTGAASPSDRYVVRVNDGMWNVAEALLGDGSRHVEMAALAVGQEVAPGVVFTADTYVIHPGWVFTLDTATTRAPADTYVVRSGDSLSSIADQHLGASDRWSELWDLNRDRTMGDGRIFDDPDLILPGWQLRLVEPDDARQAQPTSSDETPTTVDSSDTEVDTGSATTPPNTNGGPAPAAEPTVAPDSESPEDATPVPADPPAQPPTDESPLPPPSAEERQPQTPASESLPVPTTTSDTAVDQSVDTALTAEATWQRSVWFGVAGGTLLLAGLAAMTRRLRNRRLGRLEPGRRLATPPDVAAGAELAVARSSQRLVELTTLRGLLQSVTPYAAEQSDPPAVRAVQIGDDRVEILFASPAPLPPRGWTTVDGGQSWTHRFDEEAVTSRQLLTPALVTIGVRTSNDGDEVLLDLETAASVSISGDREAATGLARSMALELATYPLGTPVEVGIVGMHVDGTETCDRVWLDTSLQRAVRVTRQRLEHIGLDGATTMVAARAELEEDDGAHDPMVFIVDASAVADAERPLLDELVDICQPSTGTAVIVVGEHSGANEHVIVDADGRLAWADVELVAPNVTLRAAAEAAVMLDHAANADDEPLQPGRILGELLAVDESALFESEDGDNTTADAADDVPDYEYKPPPHDVLLRLIGNVTVEGSDLTSDDVELLGVLTCLRGRTEIHIDLIQNLIAPDSVRKTVENRIGRLRKKLGVGSDDLDLLPAASATGRGLNAMYDVSPLVLTDVDLLEHRLHTAHGLGSTDALRVLADGLDLMAGPLFRARRGFDGWPHTEGVVQSATAVVTNYARDLIELAAEVDDIALVVRTAACAGRVLDNPAVEAPFRQVEAEYADACGDERLIASVECARQRLLEYLHHEDSLASS